MMKSSLSFLMTFMLLVCSANSSFAKEASLSTNPSSKKIDICTTCHGVDGRGNESIAAPKLAGMEGWYIRRQLAGFQKQYRGTHADDMDGREMSAMAEFLNEDDIDQVLVEIARWPVERPVVNVSGDVKKGAGHFAACALCHGASGEGNFSRNSPALAGQNDWYLATQLKNFKSGLRGYHPKDKYGQEMKAMANTLPDEQAIMDVVTYIQSLPLPKNVSP